MTKAQHGSARTSMQSDWWGLVVADSGRHDLEICPEVMAVAFSYNNRGFRFCSQICKLQLFAQQSNVAKRSYSNKMRDLPAIRCQLLQASLQLKEQ